MRSNTVLIFLFCCLSGLVSAQESILVSGKVQDNDTGKPLAGASVTLKGQTISTVYNPDFWKTYNIIKETPLHQRIRNDLEKDTTLEEQFRNKETTEPAKRTKRQ